MEWINFEAIYEEYYDRIYKYVYSLLLNREDAEDVTEETFLAAYAAYGSYDSNKASVATWLARIAHNRAVNLVRSAPRAKRVELPEDWETSDGTDFTEQVAASEMMGRLYAKLRPEEREFLNLRYALDMKDREIAALLGMNEKAVNKRYQRLLVHCRELLGE